MKGEPIKCAQCDHAIDVWVKDSEHCIIIRNDDRVLYFCNWECMAEYNNERKHTIQT